MIHKAPFAKFLVAAAALLAFASPPAQAQSSYFLQFDGVKGEATEKSHKDWIDIDSFAWGVHAIPGGSYGPPIIEFDDFSWVQQIDSSTPPLFGYLTSLKHINQAVAEVVAPIGGAAPKPYFRMTFNEVLLSQMSVTGAAPAMPHLFGAFGYSKITLDYWSYDSTGKLARHETAMYDLKKDSGSLGALTYLYARGMAGPEITAAVPEPETWALLLAGLGLLGFAARRKI